MHFVVPCLGNVRNRLIPVEVSIVSVWCDRMGSIHLIICVYDMWTIIIYSRTWWHLQISLIYKTPTCTLKTVIFKMYQLHLSKYVMKLTNIGHWDDSFGKGTHSTGMTTRVQTMLPTSKRKEKANSTKLNFDFHMHTYTPHAQIYTNS